MNSIEVLSKVGTDGILHLAVPFPAADAGRDVRVIVEPLPRPTMTQEEWRTFVLQTAGSWHGDFERPEQGDYEVRESLS